jgi:hypothetical protein
MRWAVELFHKSVKQHRGFEEAAASLFRDPDEEAPPVKRLGPQHKRLWASLPYDQDGDLVSATDETFAWLAHEVARRNPKADKPTLLLMDGQKSLWEAAQRDVPSDPTVEILDLLHATPRIWDAAHLFYDRDSDDALDFVYDRVLRMLRGEVRAVVSGLRQMGTKRKLRGKKREQLATICGYLQNNAHRMRYDAHLAAGYPIASGVIEDACRHFVKDRMERSGMRWTIESAQAMLDLRSTYLNGDWDTFMAYRIKQETQRSQRLGILPIANPPFLFFLGDPMVEMLQRRATEQGFPFRTLWDAGFPLSFGSDSPGYYPVDPLRDLGTAVAHQTLSGQTITAGEALTMLEALRSQTLNAAYTGFQEKALGSIEGGKLADIVVLGDDPLTFTPERFQELPVDITIASGKIVHTGAVRSPAGAPAVGAGVSCSCRHR